MQNIQIDYRFTQIVITISISLNESYIVMLMRFGCYFGPTMSMISFLNYFSNFSKGMIPHMIMKQLHLTANPFTWSYCQSQTCINSLSLNTVSANPSVFGKIESVNYAQVASGPKPNCKKCRTISDARPWSSYQHRVDAGAVGCRIEILVANCTDFPGR